MMPIEPCPCWAVTLATVLAAACHQRDPGPASQLRSAGNDSLALRALGAADAGGPPASPELALAVAEFATERERMVSNDLIGRDVRDPGVLEAMRRVPRHRFVLEGWAHLAYADGPLPIPGGQTISQPYIVAFMSEAAQVRPGARCLEIGTGSGYQAAVLTELCRETYSIEYLPEVAAFARRNLEALGYLERGLFLRVGDGYAGWPERAPFDAILVTAAPEKVPPPLLAQLALRGHLVIPVGDGYGQELEVWRRVAPGSARRSFERKVMFGVQFVPFLGPRGG